MAERTPSGPPVVWCPNRVTHSLARVSPPASNQKWVFKHMLDAFHSFAVFWVLSLYSTSLCVLNTSLSPRWWKNVQKLVNLSAVMGGVSGEPIKRVIRQEKCRCFWLGHLLPLVPKTLANQLKSSMIRTIDSPVKTRAWWCCDSVHWTWRIEDNCLKSHEFWICCTIAPKLF